MNSYPARRGHRKRISALRLSTDSNVTALPLYTSPPWQRPVQLIDDPVDLPPEYPSSAEEADADTDTDDEAAILYSPPPAPLSFSPRRTRRSQGSSRSRRQNPSNEPYLDSLLARSVHALEMSNVLMQSSMSTQSSLNNVLTRDSAEADMSLETHARTLTSRITTKSTWMEDLDRISKGVEDLFTGEEDGAERGMTESMSEEPISQSLPASTSLSSVADRFTRSHLRRPSLDLRNASLQYSSHDRDDLVAPPPRATTMYVDGTEDPDTIPIPSTLGLRSTSRLLPSTPLSTESSFSSRRPLLLRASGSETTIHTKSAMDVLSSYAAPRTGSSTRSSSNERTVSPASFRTRPRSGSASTSTTTTGPRKGRSPLHGASRSPSHSPCRSSRKATWDTAPIVELPSASSSSSSEDLHVDRTLNSLRTILQNNPPPSPPKPKSAPLPSFLKPPPVVPVADASHATASVSRLFTKPRHTSSTRPPSPPRMSAMKGRSGRSAPPTPISPALSLSSSWLSVSDAMGIGTSGRSTPNRVSFAELPDRGPKDKDKAGARSHSKRKGKGKRRAGDSSDEGGKWWTWLLGPTASGSAVPSYIKREETLSRGSWGPRPGLGGSVEEWGV